MSAVWLLCLWLDTVAYVSQMAFRTSSIWSSSPVSWKERRTSDYPASKPLFYLKCGQVDAITWLVWLAVATQPTHSWIFLKCCPVSIAHDCLTQCGWRWTCSSIHCLLLGQWQWHTMVASTHCGYRWRVWGREWSLMICVTSRACCGRRAPQVAQKWVHWAEIVIRCSWHFQVN